MIATEKSLLGATGEQWALIVALPLNQAANMALFAVLGPFRGDFGLSYATLGVVLASYGLARLVMDIPAGLLLRRFPLRAALLTGMAGNLASAMWPLASTEVWQIVAARIVQGVSSSIVQAAILAWLIIGARSAARGRVMALSEALFSGVGLVVPLASGGLASFFGWRAAFITASLAGLLACLAILVGTDARNVPEARQEQTDVTVSSPGIWATLTIGGGTLLAGLLLAFIVAFSRSGMINTLMPVIGADQLGLTPIQVGLGQTLVSTCSIVVLMIGGWAGDRFGRRRLTAPGVALLLLCQASLFAINSQTLYYAVLVLMSLSFFVNSFPTSLVGDALPRHLRSIGISGYRLMTDAGILLAPAIVGAVSDLGGLNAPKVATMGITAVVLVLIVAATGRGMKRAPSATMESVSPQKV